MSLRGLGSHATGGSLRGGHWQGAAGGQLLRSAQSRRGQATDRVRPWTTSDPGVWAAAAPTECETPGQGAGQAASDSGVVTAQGGLCFTSKGLDSGQAWIPKQEVQKEQFQWEGEPKWQTFC